MGVIDRVHCHTADRRPDPHPALASGFTYLHVHVVFVADCADGGIALFKDHPHFAGGELECNVIPFLGRNQRPDAGGTDNLASLPEGKFHVVNRKTQGDVLQRKGVPGFDGGVRPADYPGVYHKPFGGNNVALLSVGIFYKGDV